MTAPATESRHRINLTVPSKGWVPVPGLDSGVDRAEWVQTQEAKVRAGHGGEWPDGFSEYLHLILDAAFDHRREEDDFLFQVWPSALPICVFVHVSFGALTDDDLASSLAGALLYDGGPGVGLQIPWIESHAEGDLFGNRFVFAADGQALLVDVEPTTIELLAEMMPALHSVLQKVEVTGDDGVVFRAQTPSVLGADPRDSWVDSMTTL